MLTNINIYIFIKYEFPIYHICFGCAFYNNFLLYLCSILDFIFINPKFNQASFNLLLEI